MERMGESPDKRPETGPDTGRADGEAPQRAPEGTGMAVAADGSEAGTPGVSRSAEFVRGRRRMTWLVPLFVALPILAVLVSLTIGVYSISLPDVCRIVWCGITGTKFTSDAYANPQLAYNMVWTVRLPRVVASSLVGAGLGMAGAVFQGVFRNPLASPYTLGVSNGAGFGAAIAIVLGLSMGFTQGSAIAFGLASVALTFAVASRSSRSNVTLVLAGMLISSLFSSLVSLIKFVADPAEKLPQIVYWLMGSFSGVSFDKLVTILPLYVVSVVVLLCYRWRLNVLSVGDVEARSFGVNVTRDRNVAIVAASVISAVAVSVSGIIGWVGIVVPHLARMITGPDYRRLLPVSLSLGAVYLCVIDDVCRALTTAEIPIGVVTGIIGVPLFLFFIYKKKVNW